MHGEFQRLQSSNYTPANLAAVDSGSDGGGIEASSGASSAESKHRTDIIVGVVVGVGGALVLTAILAWLLLRRRKQQKGKELGAEPYDVSEKDLYGTASWAPHNALDWPDTPPNRSGPAPVGSTRPRPRRIVQEQDAAEGLEHSPPVYEGEQLTSAVDGSTPGWSFPDDSTRPLANGARERPGQPSALKIDTKRVLEAGPDSASRYTTHVTTPQLKEEYARVFGVPRSPAERTARTPEHTPPLKEEYARAFDLS